MYNEESTSTHTTETDAGGGTRTVEEQGKNKEVIFTEENGKNVPATQTIISPKIEGVIVIAQGASDRYNKSKYNISSRSSNRSTNT